MSRLTITYLFLAFFGAMNAETLAQTKAEKAQGEWARLQEVSEALKSGQFLGRDPESDLAGIASLADYNQYIDRVASEFAAEIKTDNQPFRNLGYKIEHLRNELKAFERSARAYCSKAAIDEDLDHIITMAKRAIEYQAPAYFRPENDIYRRTETAKQRIRYLQAMDADSKDLKDVKLRMGATANQVLEIQQSLAAGILEQNELPPDSYTASDREALLMALRDKWTKDGIKSPVLQVGIVGPEWTRRVTWEIQNRTLYKVDQSRMQGYVIVEFSDKVALRHSINLIRDHLSNDKLTAHFVSDPRSEPDLIHQILKTKLK